MYSKPGNSSRTPALHPISQVTFHLPQRSFPRNTLQRVESIEENDPEPAPYNNEADSIEDDFSNSLLNLGDTCSTPRTDKSNTPLRMSLSQMRSKTISPASAHRISHLTPTRPLSEYRKSFTSPKSDSPIKRHLPPISAGETIDSHGNPVVLSTQPLDCTPTKRSRNNDGPAVTEFYEVLKEQSTDYSFWRYSLSGNDVDTKIFPEPAVPCLKIKVFGIQCLINQKLYSVQAEVIERASLLQDDIAEDQLLTVLLSFSICSIAARGLAEDMIIKLSVDQLSPEQSSELLVVCLYQPFRIQHNLGEDISILASRFLIA